MDDALKVMKTALYTDKRSFHIALGDDESVVNKYILGIYNTIVNNTALQKCNPQSIKDAAITSATLDVPVDARHLAYLIPYNDKVQFQLSYKGYVYIAKKDGDVDNIQSVVVYKGDEFSVNLGMNTINHIPNLNSESYGKESDIEFVYAVVRFRHNTGRAPMFEVMTRKQIDDIRGSSKAGGVKDKWGKPTIWEKYYGEMARKTAIKRLCKHAQLGDVAKFDELDNSIDNHKVINVTPTGEMIVDSVDDNLVKEIIDAVEGCNSEKELEAVQAKYQDNVQEFGLYNVSASKEVTKAMGKKGDEIFIESVTGYFEGCFDEEGIDAIYNNHEKRINQLKAKDRDSVKEIYRGLKQHFVDEKVA